MADNDIKKAMEAFKIPEEAEKQIILAAANISGKPQEELTIDQAMEILGGGHPDPVTDAIIDEWSENMGNLLFEDFTDEQFKKLAGQAESGALQENLTKIMEQLNAQDAPFKEPFKIRLEPAGSPDQDGQAPDGDSAEDIGAAFISDVLTDAVTEMIGELDKLFPDARTDDNIIADILQQLFTTFQQLFDVIPKEYWPYILELKDLHPYLDDELKDPKYKGVDIGFILKSALTGARPLEETLFYKVVTAARAAKYAAEGKPARTPRTSIKRAEKVEYPLDKPNSILWNLLERDTAGQVTFDVAKKGSKLKLPVYYAIDFEGLGNNVAITKRLTPFDKLVYIAVAALFNAGNNIITLSQIYYAMGYTGRPGEKDLARVNDAITKMTTARIFIDNEQEAKKYKYDRFKYDASLLPLERGTAIVNGQLANAAIHIFREPPLITFAKQRGQITTLDIKLLQAPVSKTDSNLQIQDYLLERISKLKNRKARSGRILFETLYKNTGIEERPRTNTERQRKKRAPDKIKKYLTHYQKEGFINWFTMEKDGITIHW